MIRANRILLAIPALVIFALGCSGGGKNPNAPASVSGEVTYKGQKLGGGTITLYFEKTETTLTITSDGTFTGSDLPSGEVLVSIETDSVKGQGTTSAAGERGGAGQKRTFSPAPPDVAGGAASQATYVKIPDKYKNKNKSGLTWDLKPGRNTKVFELD